MQGEGVRNLFDSAGPGNRHAIKFHSQLLVFAFDMLTLFLRHSTDVLRTGDWSLVNSLRVPCVWIALQEAKFSVKALGSMFISLLSQVMVLAPYHIVSCCGRRFRSNIQM